LAIIITEIKTGLFATVDRI